MPTISRFLGITIRIYSEDHGVPHFHAYYGESEASLAIETLEILEGELPPRVRALVLEWASDRREALRENWQRAKEHSPLRALNPLQ